MKSKIHEFPKNKLMRVGKKFLIAFAFLPFLLACDGGNINYKNPNIPNYPVNLSLNLSLPQYSNLQFPSNHIIDYSQGARGIVVFNTGSGFNAFDLACPNQPFTGCALAMSISGIEAKCNCNTSENPYSLFSGQSAGQQYPMKPYYVEMSGGNLIIHN
jgi:hypothetical protein